MVSGFYSLPLNVGKCGGSNFEIDEEGQKVTRDGCSHSLGSDMCWENLGDVDATGMISRSAR